MAVDLKEAALQLAEEGFAVFPVGLDKAPHTANGYYDATRNPEVINAWDWDGMIGAAISPGTVVVDVDPRNGGSATQKMLKEAGHTFPPTRVVRTGGGGFHYYFTVPPELPMRSKLGPGIDVQRAGKGYVIVPPSRGYVWLSQDQAPAPQWLLDELEVPEADPVTHSASQPKFFPWEDGTPYGMAALEREMGRLATAGEGTRNETLNKAAFALSQLAAGGEISRKKCVNDLAGVALRIGLDIEEAKATIQSGWAAGAKVPRQASARAERVDGESLISTPTTLVPAEQVPPAPAEEEESGIATQHEEEERAFWVDWEVDEPPPPFYLWPVLPKNAYVWVYGATEAAKSMTLNALGAEASHHNFRVSIYSFENPPITDRDRLRRLHPNPRNFRLTNQPVDLNDARQLAEMIHREKDWGDGRGTDIVIMDTYSHAFSSRSEDGNAKAIEFARRVRHLMHVVGCSVVIVDHTGYAQEDEPRDASAKRQQVDVAVLMKKAGEWRPGSPARFTMTNKKAARFANPFHLTGEIRDTKDSDIRGLELGWVAEKPRWDT